MTPSPVRTRAAALPTEERRAAIVQAALPLFLEGGAGVTTREIAEAAGIAEGTIFRVFDDKGALIEAVIDAAFDPAPVEAALAAIPRSLPLAERLEAAVDILARRGDTIFRVMSAVATMRPNPSSTADSSRRQPPDLPALVDLFTPDAARLRRTPDESAQLLRGLTFASTHPAFARSGPPASAAQIVSWFLHGIEVPAPQTAPQPEAVTPC
jgi:AcrR family transcriptional regulator